MVTDLRPLHTRVDLVSSTAMPISARRRWMAMFRTHNPDGALLSPIPLHDSVSITRPAPNWRHPLEGHYYNINVTNCSHRFTDTIRQIWIQDHERNPTVTRSVKKMFLARYLSRRMTVVKSRRWWRQIIWCVEVMDQQKAEYLHMPTASMISHPPTVSQGVQNVQGSQTSNPLSALSPSAPSPLQSYSI